MSTPPPLITADIPTHLAPANPYTFNPTTDIPSQIGKVFLITGATSGIGAQSAVELARHEPAQIWIAGRNVTDGQAVVEEVKSAGRGVDVKFLEMDLTSFDSIRVAASRVLARTKKIDVLMLNAGIVCTQISPSPRHANGTSSSVALPV
jgi:retinol dehydrogenase-12